MNMIRTTVSLREDESEVRQKIKKSREFFRRLAKSGKHSIDVVKAVREMRDERLEQITKNAGI